MPRAAFDYGKHLKGEENAADSEAFHADLTTIANRRQRKAEQSGKHSTVRVWHNDGTFDPKARGHRVWEC